MLRVAIALAVGLTANGYDKYGYYPAFVDQVANPDALLVPCGKTGCEPLMKA